MPDYEVEDAEDAYTLYVLILGISEHVFFNADVSFLASVVADKAAYGRWENAAQDAARREVR